MSDRLVAAGFFQAPPPSGEGDVIEEVRVWSTFDGANWEHIASMSGMHLVSLASRGDVLAALVYPNDRPGQVAILRSEDFGLTWQEQALPEGLPQSIIAIVAGPDRFVAVGDEVAISSVDGRQWSATPSDPSVLAGVNGIFTVPGGFLATRYGRVDGQESTECREVGGPYIPRPSHDGGSESVLTPPPTPRETICSTSPQGGGTAFSRDGVEWSVGPDLPSTTAGGLNGRYLLAGLGDGLVMSEIERGGSVWYSPLEPFLTSR
jgi:hypothetical protein